MKDISTIVKASFGFLLFLLAGLAGASTIDHGDVGVIDDTPASSILQLLTESDAPAGAAFFVGDTDPADETELDNVLPWRKDGRWLVFTVNYDSTAESERELCKIRPDGSSFTRLTNNDTLDSNASFTISDSLIFNILTFDEYDRGVARSGQDGSDYQNLSLVASGSDDETKPLPSPDGRKVAYRNISNGRLYVMNSDGSSPVVVSGVYMDPLEKSIGVWGPAPFTWSPDSQWIVYSGHIALDQNGYRLFKVRPDGSDHQQILFNISSNVDFQSPVWSPDGTAIVYRFQYYSGGGPITTHQLRTLTPDGTPLHTLDTAHDTSTVTGYSTIYPPFSFSPDSRWIAYSKSYSNGGTVTSVVINIVKTDGSEPPVQLTCCFYDYSPFWGPHGNQIAFVAADHRPSRECGVSPYCAGQIMILNLKGDFGSSIPFPWPMIIPAVTGAGR